MFSFLQPTRSSHSPILKRATSARLGSSVELLEARIAPASLTTFSKGNLLLRGDPDGSLAFTQTSEVVGGATVITTSVTDNGVPVTAGGPFVGVKNIIVKLAKASTDETSIQMDLIGLGGSVQVFAPMNGGTYLQVRGLTPVGDLPHIGGSIQLTGGQAYESLVISSANVAGGFNLQGGKGGNGLFINGDVSFGGNISVLDTATVQIAPGAMVGGNVLITQKMNVTESFTFGNGAKIGGNVVIFAGPGSTSINAYSEVAGRFFVNAGGGPTAMNVALAAKSLEFVGSGSNDQIFLYRSTITDFVRVNVGGGMNTVAFDVGATLALAGDFQVGKAFTVAGGSGNDVVRLDSGTYKLSTGGKTVISLGSGANVFAWNGVSTSTAIQITTGGGQDVVGLAGLSAPSAVLTAALGANADQLRMSAGFLRASLNGQGGTDELLGGSAFPADVKVRGFEVGVP